MALSTTSLTMKEVADTLGIDTSNGITLKTLCTSSAINKWSKHKPVAYATNSPLTEAQFRGDRTEFGYYYGVHLATANNDYTEIESVGFEYEQPTSNFRLGDFRGYDHYAACTLLGVIIGKIEGKGILCSLGTSTVEAEDAGSTGIDYAALVEEKTGVALDDCYLCALVHQGSNYWVRACNTYSGGVSTIGNYTSSQEGWAIPIQDISGLSRATGATAIISLFILQSLAYLNDASYFATWQTVSSGQLYAYQGFAIPNAVAKEKSVEKASTYNGTITLNGDTTLTVSVSSSVSALVTVVSETAWTCTYTSASVDGFTMSVIKGLAGTTTITISVQTLTITDEFTQLSSIDFKDSSGIIRATLTVEINGKD